MSDVAGTGDRTGDYTVRLVAPPPDDPPRASAHGGFKLDWHSEVGRTGALVEWRPVGRDGDAGVPLPVMRALAAGCCAAATVTGCTLDVPATAGSTWTPAPGGYATRFPGRRRFRVGPLPVGALATRDPAVAARFFDDSTFAWTNESQVLILSDPERLPRLDHQLVEACLSVPIEVTAARLVDAGVGALLRAGVDGAVAGLYFLDSSTRARLVHALADAVAAGGGRWEESAGMAYWTAAGGGPRF